MRSPAPHPQSSSGEWFIDLGSWTRSWSKPTPSTLLWSSGIHSPSWTSLWLRCRTCHWVGELCGFRSPAFVNVKLTFSPPRIWLPVTLNGILLPGGGDRCTRGSGDSDPGFAAHKALEWWRRRHLLFPLHKHPPPDMYNTRCFSLFKPKVLIQVDSLGSLDFLFIRPTQKTGVNSLWQPYELQGGSGLITPWNEMTHQNQAEFLKVLTVSGPASSASFPKAKHRTWEAFHGAGISDNIVTNLSCCNSSGTLTSGHKGGCHIKSTIVKHIRKHSSYPQKCLGRNFRRWVYTI